MTSEELANQIRISSLKMCHKAKASHIGGCLSCADILAVLYNEILTENDKLIVSKGHCAAAVYSALALTGKIPMEWLNRYCQDGAELGGHVTYGVPGVEVSTGSLGHGLSIGCGMAIANPDKRVFVLMSDGEFNEGSVWESLMFAAWHKLTNLAIIVDYNGLQSFGATLVKDLGDKIKVHGLDVFDENGSYLEGLRRAMYNVGEIVYPVAIIVHTIKGQGVSYMGGKLEWHYKYPNEEELKLALSGLDA